MYVFCVGMYRSCSTWQYNVACRLLERHRGASRLGALTADAFREVDRRGQEPAAWQVLKSHDGDPAFAAALGKGRALALYSYRDLRDVAFSLAHKFGQPFEQVTAEGGPLPGCLVNDAFWRAQPRTLCQQYDRLIEDPLAGVREIAAHLGIETAEGEAGSLVEEFSLSANRERTDYFADQLRREGRDLDDPANALLWDPDTLLHWNHIRTGEIGSWRRLAGPSQVATLVVLCGSWLIERGYERDLAWGRVGLDYLTNLTRREVPALREQLVQSGNLLQEQAGALEAARRTLEEQAAALGVARRNVEELEARLVPYDGIGPGALGIARRAKRLGQRFPRLAGWARHLMRRSAAG
jgi:hypothetical protein